MHSCRIETKRISYFVEVVKLKRTKDIEKKIQLLKSILQHKYEEKHGELLLSVKICRYERDLPDEAAAIVSQLSSMIFKKYNYLCVVIHISESGASGYYFPSVGQTEEECIRRALEPDANIYETEIYNGYNGK